MYVHKYWHPNLYIGGIRNTTLKDDIDLLAIYEILNKIVVKEEILNFDTILGCKFIDIKKEKVCVLL